MTSEEKINNALRLDYEQASCSARGHILQRSIDLESNIDFYIAQYFCQKIEKVEEIVTLILSPRMTFENKAQVFRILVNKYNPSFQEAYPKYFNDFLKIMEKRNEFAHFPINVTPESLENFKLNRSIEFIKFKNVSEKNTNAIRLTNIVQYTSIWMDEFVDLIYNYIDATAKLLRDF
jgi:hypothetical protein